jgi:hypothetical protein
MNVEFIIPNLIATRYSPEKNMFMLTPLAQTVEMAKRNISKHEEITLPGHFFGIPPLELEELDVNYSGREFKRKTNAVRGEYIYYYPDGRFSHSSVISSVSEANRLVMRNVPISGKKLNGTVLKERLTFYHLLTVKGFFIRMDKKFFRKIEEDVEKD